MHVHISIDNLKKSMTPLDTILILVLETNGFEQNQFVRNCNAT
jgi:hypothetical protein